MPRHSRIIIENAYPYRRPYSPGNPAGRRGIFVDEQFPYAAGILNTVSGGKWLTYGGQKDLSTLAPNNVDVSSANSARLDAAAAQNENWQFFPVASTPAINANQPYTVRGNFTITDFTGIREVELNLEGGDPGAGKINNCGHRFQIFQSGGFISYQVVNYSNAVLDTGFVNVGFGAGLMVAGAPFDMSVEVTIVGANHVYVFKVANVQQSTGNMQLPISGMKGMGFLIASSIPQFDHVFCNRFSYWGASL